MFILACLVVFATHHAHAGFRLDDITYWIGHGTNRAALVIDWNDGMAPASLAWGFRWNGTATGQDMLEAVAEQDSRLRVVFVNQGFGDTLYGAGYDLDNDGGAFYPGSPGIGSETGYAGDPDDHYEEGWYSQYWHYATGDSNPFDGGSWSSAGGGATLRQLRDGDWDGWRIAPAVYPPPPSNPPPAECVAASPTPPAPVLPMAGFAFRDIEFWTGSGTNRAALVIDWHDGTRRHALAWGYRWNGQATALDLWQAVTNADEALSGTLQQTPQGRMFSTCRYARTSRHDDVLPGTAAHDVETSAYAFDHTNTLPGATWSHWTIDYSTAYHKSITSASETGLNTRQLYNNSWDIWSRTTNGLPRAPGWPSAALHYPFADEVVSYSEGSGVGVDWISGDAFTNAALALGRPTDVTTGDNGTIPIADTAPVVPVYAAFRAHELVEIGLGGHLTLAFDHPVLDNPANPHGVDLLLFGNAAQTIGQQKEWENGDPSKTIVSGSCEDSRGAVSVSQDGVTWHPVTNVYCDSFMPTLGRVYDPDHVDAALGAWNEWWGFATDPTLPPDPDIISSNWQGYTVSEIARRYRGSAGGTGLDISSLDLPVCTNTGHKWIQYVRIEAGPDIKPEVDAVADVSPALPLQRWRTEAFAWMSDPMDSADALDADGDGLPNLLEYALGRDPTNAMYSPAFESTLCSTTTPHRLYVDYTVSTNAADVDVALVRTDDLQTPVWRTNGVSVSPAAVASNGVLPLRAAIDIDVPKSFLQLRVQHDE